MGYFCGLPPARTEEERRTAPARHAQLQAEWDARRTEWAAECARLRAAQPWWRRLLCRFRLGCKRPDDAKWGDWSCRYCGRPAL